jgi:hypothetical protein
MERIGRIAEPHAPGRRRYPHPTGPGSSRTTRRRHRARGRARPCRTRRSVRCGRPRGRSVTSARSVGRAVSLLGNAVALAAVAVTVRRLGGRRIAAGLGVLARPQTDYAAEGNRRFGDARPGRYALLGDSQVQNAPIEEMFGDWRRFGINGATIRQVGEYVRHADGCAELVIIAQRGTGGADHTARRRVVGHRSDPGCRLEHRRRALQPPDLRRARHCSAPAPHRTVRSGGRGVVRRR